MLAKFVLPELVSVSMIFQLWGLLQNALPPLGSAPPREVRPKSSVRLEVPPNPRFPLITTWSKSTPGLLVESAASCHTKIPPADMFRPPPAAEPKLARQVL